MAQRHREARLRKTANAFKPRLIRGKFEQSAPDPTPDFSKGPIVAMTADKHQITDVAKSLDGLGFDRVETIQGTTYKDNSTVVIVPSREKKFHHRVVASWQNLIAPMNQKRAFIMLVNDEVGVAYNNMIQHILDDPNLSSWKYIMTLETDNLPPPDAHIRLLESIEEFKLDAVSGIYFTRGDINMPMAYGDPAEFSRTGVLDFRPRDIRQALANGRVMTVNGIAMGCALWRLDLFRETKPPWFITVADVINGTAQAFTQDLEFCQKAKRAGKTFGVDFRVRVGHMDLNTEVVY